MRIETLDELPPEVDEIGRRCPWATFYHTRTWIESVAASFPKWEFRCLVAREGDRTVGYLPYFVTRRGPASSCWSLPFGTYGGPVALEAGEVESRLVERFFDVRRRFGVYEVGLVDLHRRATHSGLRVQEATTHVIDLREGFQALWDRRFDHSKRSQTRRAGREGVSVTEVSSLEETRQYYSIYEKRTREWKLRFRYPEALFVELVKRNHGDVRLFLARSGETLLGGLLNFYFADTVIVWNAVTALPSRRLQVSTLLYSSSIRHACDNGYTSYNLGGSLGKSSLVDYKEALGGMPFTYRMLLWRSLSGKIVSAIRTRSPAH